MNGVSTEAWIGVAGLALSVMMAVCGSITSVLVAAFGYLIKRSIDQVDEKVSIQGARQDRFCDRLGSMERNFAASTQANLTMMEEIKRLRDIRHDDANREHLVSLKNQLARAVMGQTVDSPVT